MISSLRLAGPARARVAIALGAAIAALGFTLAQSASAEARTYYTVLQAEHSSMYITTDYGLGSGAPAFQWYNADWPESQWFIDNHDGRDGFRFKSRWNGLCLDLENNSTAAGTRVVQMPCDGTLSQEWTYNSEQDAGSQFYRHIYNQYSGLVMDVRGASLEAGAEIIMWPRNGGTNQRFKIEGRSDDSAALTQSDRADASTR
jgi:hypothetical protein